MRNRYVSLLLLISGTVFLFACQTDPVDSQWDLNAELIRIAEDYSDEHIPSWRKGSEKTPVVCDYGDHWEVHFDLPKGVYGGSPHILIEKDTLKVFRAYVTQ